MSGGKLSVRAAAASRCERVTIRGNISSKSLLQLYSGMHICERGGGTSLARSAASLCFTFLILYIHKTCTRLTFMRLVASFEFKANLS